MKKDNWLFVLIAVLLLITLMHGTDAQDNPLKDKYKVKIELMNKRQFFGKLIEASQDSLVIWETKGIVVGSQVKVFLTEEYFLSGEIVRISDTTVILKTETAPSNQVIRFSRINRIATKSYPPDFDKDTPLRTSIPISQIAKIRLSKKGSGAAGFLVGGLIGAAVGFGIGSANNPEGKLSKPHAASLAILGFPIGGLVGAALAGQGRTYEIAGDPVSYNKFLKKLK